MKQMGPLDKVVRELNLIRQLVADLRDVYLWDEAAPEKTEGIDQAIFQLICDIETGTLGPDPEKVRMRLEIHELRNQLNQLAMKEQLEILTGRKAEAS